LSIHFTKDLTRPDPAPRQKLPRAAVHVETVGPNSHGLVAQLASDTVEPRTAAEIDREMANPNPLALVAFVDGKPVGFKVGHGRDARGHLFESRIGGVLPEYRNRGVATALARHQLDAVAELGYRAVRVHAPHDNSPVIGLALGLGFDIVGMTFDSRRKCALVILERQLTAGSVVAQSGGP
jgi:ribosomal protein S18 acetylase RimI-like enzyme